MRPSVFALLDDATGRGQSRLYTGYERLIRCSEPAQLDATWSEVEAAQAAGLHALLLADYEWGCRLQGIPAEGGALRVLLFRRCRRVRSAQVERWLAAAEGQAAPGACGIRATCPDMSPDEFEAAVAAIQQAIHAGETYQVNLTYRLSGQMGGDPIAWYRRLRARQPVPYGAFIALPPEEPERFILSFSPELFLRHVAGQLTAKPMKGTAPRHRDPASDLLAREDLATPKSRAENLMIVDLLRNDLGRVATVGSVAVPGLFEVEAHPTVWQMTSTVTARLPVELRFPELLRALFPCGSVTGAPKHRTLQIIRRHERSARGIYCGAIGWVDSPPGERGCGDFCLSVPIRTLTLGPPEAGWRPWRLGIGAGIVADSRAAAERAECELKARFLTGLESGFALIETMRVEDGQVPLLARHLARLSASAAALGFACDRPALEAQVRTTAATLVGVQRLRLLLAPDGQVSLSHGLLEALAPGPVRVGMAMEPIDPDAWPLAHKTTLRVPYERALALAQAAGLFDLLFFNAFGELTEGARSNVFVRLEGRWWTPPLQGDVLPGVMRAVILDDPAWSAGEAVITRADLARAEAIVVCNALRGALPAVLAASAPPARRRGARRA